MDMLATDVIELSVVGFSYEGVYGTDLFVACLGHGPRNDGFDGGAHAEGVGEDDGGFDGAEFLDLRGAGEFAEGVADEYGARNFLLEEIAGMRENSCHTGAYIGAFDNRCMADANAGDVGDGVERPRVEDAGDYAQSAGAEAGFFGGSQTDGRQNADGGKQKVAAEN
jgi:hypothetical protein